MDQIGENTKINKKIVIAIISFILILSVIIAGVIFWQKKQGAQTKQAAQNNQKVEDNVVSGADVNGNKNSEEKELGKISTLSFGSQQQTAKINDKIILNATVDPKGKEITAAELHISFDPKALKLESVVSSDIFSTELSKANIDNEKGAASIILGVQMGKPATEISTIATFNFEVVSASGNTEVSFTDQTKVAAKGQSTNALASSSPVTFILQK